MTDTKAIFGTLLFALLGIASPAAAQRVATSDASSAGDCWDVIRPDESGRNSFDVANNCEYPIFVRYCFVYLQGGVRTGQFADTDFRGDACRPGPNAGSEVAIPNTVGFRGSTLVAAGEERNHPFGLGPMWDSAWDLVSGYRFQQVEVWAGACRAVRSTYDGRAAIELTHRPTVGGSDGERPTSYTCEPWTEESVCELETDDLAGLRDALEDSLVNYQVQALEACFASVTSGQAEALAFDTELPLSLFALFGTPDFPYYFFARTLDLIKGLEERLRWPGLHAAVVNAQDEYGLTASHHAVVADMPEHLEVLIENGADLHIRDSDGDSVLDLAEHEGFSSSAIDEVLERHGLKRNQVDTGRRESRNP